MHLPDNILKSALKNVYFIWGSGKTTTANALAEKYGAFIYHTDDRAKHFKAANPENQPAMCRDVKNFWEIEPTDAIQWEQDILREMTPMIICDLLQLVALHKTVICEGDIDFDVIYPVVSNAVVIVNNGDDYDFFNRPEQKHMLNQSANTAEILRLADIKQSEFLQKAAEAGIKQIIRDNTTTAESIADAAANYWGFDII